MTLTEEQLATAYAELAARFQLKGQSPNIGEIRAALAMARPLVTEEPASEPAAMFYALARHPRAFPGLTRLMTALVAMSSAREHGIVLGASDADALEGMVFSIAAQRISFEHVLVYFRSRAAQA